MKNKFNGQIIIRNKALFQNNDGVIIDKFEDKDIINKLKVNLSTTLKIIKRKNSKKDLTISKKLYLKIINNNLKKYNSNPAYVNIISINNLIKCKSCHFLAKFKEYLITDYAEEFLRRIYLKKESIERMPKIYNYYQNYLKFFCQPTFIVPFANQILKNYGDLNAEYFYKNNLINKRTKIDEKKLDIKNNESNNNYNIINNENNLDQNIQSFGKTVFTKSIKNSIDNIKIEDFSLSEKKITKLSQIEGESIVKIYGNEEDETNSLMNNNSLISMINEIKDKKEEKIVNKKPKIKEKTIKISDRITDNNNYKNICSFAASPRNVDSRSIKSRNYNNNKEKHNFEKAKTCVNNLYFESLKNMVYSPKSNKKSVFFLKKENINKAERYLSPKAGIIKNETIQKNRNPIIVNINININTNKESISNKTNTSNNIYSLKKNLVYKSPSHKISETKKKFAFSPISSKYIKNNKQDEPLLSERNGETRKSNYIKIVRRKSDYNKIVLNTDKNIRNKELKNIRTLNIVESFELFNKQNLSSNKENLLYNKQLMINSSQNKENIKYNKININTQELYSNVCNENNDKIYYFSPSKFGKNQQLKIANKNFESNNDLKKYVYQKKSNQTISSPLNKKNKLNKRFFYLNKAK